MNETCAMHSGLDSRVSAIEKSAETLGQRASALENRAALLDRDSAVTREKLLSAASQIAGLPDALCSVRDTMIQLQFRIAGFEESLESLESKLSRVDDEGKFNLRLWLRDNWVTLAAAAAAFAAAGSRFI